MNRINFKNTASTPIFPKLGDDQNVNQRVKNVSKKALSSKMLTEARIETTYRKPEAKRIKSESNIEERKEEETKPEVDSSHPFLSGLKKNEFDLLDKINSQLPRETYDILQNNFLKEARKEIKNGDTPCRCYMKEGRVHFSLVTDLFFTEILKEAGMKLRNEISFKAHAIKQMIRRELSLTEVLETIKMPLAARRVKRENRLRKENQIEFLTKLVRVILIPKYLKVITVITIDPKRYENLISQKGQHVLGIAEKAPTKIPQIEKEDTFPDDGEGVFTVVKKKRK